MPKAERGLVIVYTGDGKGKTTAALGLALRAAGYKTKTLMLQFVKGTWKSGELEGAKVLYPNFEIRRMGIGFVTWRPKRPYKEHLEAAQKAWEETKQIVASNRYDIIILDEINNATRFNLIPVHEVVNLIKQKPERLHLVLTGREAAPEVIEAADLVTEMKMIKHPFQKGIWAQKWIDF
ncbi:MAG: cob(I)yrinic acid a,c-diamide adenosyltransferase [Thaumarchaeota archaeon]|nr:cob(I)yrinic acid a,c-diamide adenosyltransferase [Nitrososphaerota archaeon]